MGLTFDEEVFVSLRLLDRRVVDADGEPLGRVDDLALERDGTSARLVSIVMGPEALGARLGGVLGQLVAGAARLRPEGAGAPEVRLEEVDSVDVEVRLRAHRRDLSFPRSEGWVRDHIIARLPGAERSSSSGEIPGGSASSGGGQAANAETGGHQAAGDRIMASALLGTEVVDADGQSLGKLHDLRLAAGAGHGVAAIVTGRGVVAERFGYARGEVVGPWLLAAFMHRLARDTHEVPWSDLTEIGKTVIRVSGRADEYRPTEAAR